MGNPQKPGANAARAAAIRAERLAEQLRANLKRRKAAVKEKSGPDAGANTGSSGADDAAD
jgi:hypothetical protein